MNKTALTIIFALAMTPVLYNPIPDSIPLDPIRIVTKIPLELEPEPPYEIGEEARL